nr:DUF3800 domain-containing protein [Roseibium sp. Sym1]
MFIDDTGNVNSKTDEHPQNRYAGIVGAIMNLDYVYTRFEPSFDKLRRKFFCDNDDEPMPILHLRRMKKAEGRFHQLKDKDFRAEWEKYCFRMYERAQYTVIAVCVDKLRFLELHENWDGNFYRLLVGNAIERYFYFLKNSGGDGDVMCEATNPNLDNNLKELYREFYHDGSDHIKAHALQSRLSTNEIKIQPKSDDIRGLQLADMLASTSFSHCKRIYADGPDYDAFAMKVADVLERDKFYRDRHGNPHGYGRIWRP